jgi:hypothetical protein
MIHLIVTARDTDPQQLPLSPSTTTQGNSGTFHFRLATIMTNETGRHDWDLIIHDLVALPPTSYTSPSLLTPHHCLDLAADPAGSS